MINKGIILSISHKDPYVTGQAVAEGDDPTSLKIYSLGLSPDPPHPYRGRYPCGSLVYNGVWYYGTYCLAPERSTTFGKEIFNWPWLGPLVGFSTSTDFGRTWEESPHTPENPLFDENGMWGHPVKIGAPHFMDFGRNMEHSPEFKAISPLIDWNNNCSCVTMTYNAPMEKYLMCVTDGWPTVEKMNSYILESEHITGPWKLVVYMKEFGEQGYFLNIPSKFISKDAKNMWLCYSGNFATDWRDIKIEEDPPGSHYGLVLQSIKLRSPDTQAQISDSIKTPK